jgi:hypothetical protein
MAAAVHVAQEAFQTFQTSQPPVPYAYVAMVNPYTEWQMAAWWAYAYNAATSAITTASAAGAAGAAAATTVTTAGPQAMLASWVNAAQKNMALEREEQDAIDGLMGLSLLNAPAKSKPPTSPADERRPRRTVSLAAMLAPVKRPRRATNSVRRADVLRVFGANAKLPIKCIVNVQVDGEVVIKGRKCEIRGVYNGSLYLTSHDRKVCDGLYDHGICLDPSAKARSDGRRTILRILSYNPPSPPPAIST